MNGKPVFRVSVKTVLNLKSGFEAKLLCDGPALALGDACAYDCAFCYVPAIYQKLDRVRETLAAAGKEHHEVVILRENGLEVLKAQLVHPDGTRKFARSDKRVLYSSPADDVAANMDLVRTTIAACKLILEYTNWEIRLLSKSPLLVRVAVGLLEEGLDDVPWPITSDEIRARMIFGFSTGTLDDDVAAAIEGGTPKVSKRIEALHMLQDNGFRTFAMVCPSLPLPSRIAYSRFAAEAAARLRYDRCEHVWAEAINLRGKSFERTIAALRDAGFDAQADRLAAVALNSDAWEEYNRETFLAHVEATNRMIGKLRYLVYPKPRDRSWWEKNIAAGAVLL
jgi:DNA repair photolyase